MLLSGDLLYSPAVAPAVVDAMAVADLEMVENTMVYFVLEPYQDIDTEVLGA